MCDIQTHALGAGCFESLGRVIESTTTGANIINNQNLFANNILSCITTNYWDISTTYKPLMHLWYLGVVLQFYLLYPFLFWLCCKTPIGQSRLFAILLTLVLFSLGLYLCPFFPSTVKFYYLPFRFFELGLGGLLALLVAKKQTTPPPSKFVPQVF